MKIIFLDFDGVINDIRKDSLINPLFIENLKKLINLTGAKVVVTSNRREESLILGQCPEKTLCYQEFIKPLLQMGISVYDYTPYIEASQEKERELEIEEYLLNHPEVKEFVIIEDDYVMERLYEHQIFIENSDGFNAELIEPAIQILNGNLGFYPPSYDRSETFYERVARLFPEMFLNMTPEEIKAIINNDSQEDLGKNL